MRNFKLIICMIIMSCTVAIAQSQTKDLFPTWKWTIEPQFDVAWSFYEGLAAIKKDGRWGFIDKTGAIVIQPEFDGVKNFSDGMAAIKQKGKWGYINKNGEVTIQPKYYDAYNFRENIARVERYDNDEDYYINKNGNETPIIPIKHKSKKLTPRTESNSAIFQSSKNNKFGFVDKNKNWVIPAQFVAVKEFSDSMACVNQNGKWGFIKLYSPFEYVTEYIKAKITISQPSDIATEMIVLFDKAIEEFVESSLFSMELTLSTISDYDETNSTFLISIPAFGRLVLKVEKEDSRSLKFNWQKIKFSEPAFTIAKDMDTGKPLIILTNINIINTVNKKVHAWNSHEMLDNKDMIGQQVFEYISMSEAFGNIFFHTDSDKNMEDKIKIEEPVEKTSETEKKEENKIETGKNTGDKIKIEEPVEKTSEIEKKEENKIETEENTEDKIKIEEPVKNTSETENTDN
jgi:hypothetical protein